MKFMIKWDGSGYSVSIPNYDGGEVIPYADHAALVARVREIVEAMGHAHDCDIRRPGHMVGGISFDVNIPPRAHGVKRKCTCPRGKLLEVCEEAK